MKITSDLFEAFLKCPSKCWLRAAGEAGAGNAYAEWVKSQTASYQVIEAERLVSEAPKDESTVSLSTENLNTAKWRLAIGTVVQARMNSCVLESEIHAIARAPSPSRGRAAQFIPQRFIFTNKLGRDDKLLLAFDALVLLEAVGREIIVSKIIHGDDHATLKVKTMALISEVRKRVEKITGLLSSPSPPDLVLNRHCAECEFQARCRQKAIETDDLSLLAGMSAKERRKLRSKGIFTVTQLSYTFRPRRRPKRMRDKHEKYHHPLKALAIREKKIHIVGSPELKIDGTPVYLDVEGLPDRDFYYLIGVRIGNGDSAVQHCLWADTVRDEGKIWWELLGILNTIEKPVLIHYGSYETSFLKQMKDRHGGPPDGSAAAKSIEAALNLVSVMFAEIYFPTFSNGLKEIAGWLGYRWTDKTPSGLHSVCRRHEWERTKEWSSQQSLLAYNSDDCAALELVANAVVRICLQPGQQVTDNGPNLEIASAENLSSQDTMWPKFSSSIDAFEYINKAGRWDYQRQRVYVRTDKNLKRATTVTKVRKRRIERINKDVRCNRSRVCPTCHKRTGRYTKQRTKTLYDIRFSKFGLSRWVVRYSFRNHWCRLCRKCFGTPKEFWQQGKYGRNLTGRNRTLYLILKPEGVPIEITAGYFQCQQVGHAWWAPKLAATFETTLQL